MDFRLILLLSLQIICVLSKKYASSSDESIENLLYFKDCQQKHKEVPPSPPFILRATAPPPPKAMECPYPKMCCALTCGGNECGSAPTSSMTRPMEPVQNFSPVEPLNGPGVRPPQGVQPQARNRKKKIKQPMRIQMQPPIGGRRNFGFSKDRIKSLINQDDDIRKILKDLVRVTMQKVDLVDMISSHRNAISKPVEITTPVNSVEYDDDDDDDLE